MAEILSQAKIEDVRADAELFLAHERGTSLDGSYTARQVAERIISSDQAAESLLRSRKLAKQDGYYVALSNINASQFDEATQILPGRLVLIPATMVGVDARAGLYPAVVSEQNAERGTELRLHVMKQSYRRQLSTTADLVLSASGQSETAGVGAHGHYAGDGVEAEHFATIITAGADAHTANRWLQGEHSNHQWRAQPQNAVVTQMVSWVFGEEISQATITITKADVQSGCAVLLWHESLVNHDSGRPEAATRQDALVTIQALALDALKRRQGTLDSVKRLLAV